MNQHQPNSARQEDDRLRSRAHEHLARLSEIEEALWAPDIKKHGFGPDAVGMFAETFFVCQLDWFEDECASVLRRARLAAATRLIYKGVLAEVRRLRPLVRAVIEQDHPLRRSDTVAGC